MHMVINQLQIKKTREILVKKSRDSLKFPYVLDLQNVSTKVTKRRSLCDWLIFWGAQQADAFTWRAAGRGVCTSTGRAQEEFAGLIKTLDGLMLFAHHVMGVTLVMFSNILHT